VNAAPFLDILFRKTRRQILLGTSPPSVTEGFLYKKGKRLVEIMRKRWFVLKDNFLYYFKHKNDTKPGGIIFLEGCFIEPLKKVDGEDYFGIEIVISEEKGSTRNLYAKSEKDRDDWVAALRAAAQVYNFLDFYDIGKELGTGKFSAVHECRHKLTGKRYAVKVITKQDLTDKDRESLRTEIAILQLVNHPNVIRLKNVFESRQKMFIVMTLVEGGDLFDRLAKRKRLGEDVARSIILKLLETVQYLHSYGIVHRDVTQLVWSPDLNSLAQAREHYGQVIRSR
jgi:hypothetical protein